MLRKVLCLIIAALLLAGCVSTPAAPTTTPVTTGAPVSEPETTAPEETDPAPVTEEVTEQTTQPLTEATTEETTVPEVMGMSVSEANRMLISSGLQMVIEGSGIAVSQEPKSGETVPADTMVRVRFKAPE